MKLPQWLPSPLLRRWAALLLMLTLAGGVLAVRHSVAGEARALLPEAEQARDIHDIGATGAAECRRRRRPVRIRLSPRRWPHIADHIRDVHRTRRWPRVWHIDRRGADENRDQSIEHWEQTRGRRFSGAGRRGTDRDEVPPAVAREGRRWRGRYADVRLVNSHENRSAGAYLGNRLGPGATANSSSSSDDDGSLRKQLACVPGTAARRSHALHPIYATRYLARTGDLAGLRPGLATPTSAPRCGSPTSPPTSSTNAASAPSRGRRSRSSSTATRPERHPSLLVSKHRDTTPKPVAPEPEEEGQDDGLNGFAVRAVAELAVDAGGGA